MKKQTILQLFGLTLFLSCSTTKKPTNQIHQNVKPIKDIYKDWLSRWSFRNVTCDTLYYTENIDNAIIDSTINNIKATNTFKVSSLYRYSNAIPLTLTEEEKNYLIKELSSLKTFKWPDGLFPKSKVIKLTDVDRALSLTEKLKMENERNMCSIVYTFSKPIFLRDSTYCLYLDQQRYRTNYTQLEFDFYKKDNNFWERFSQVYIHYEHMKEKKL